MGPKNLAELIGAKHAFQTNPGNCISFMGKFHQKVIAMVRAQLPRGISLNFPNRTTCAIIANGGYQRR